MLTRIVSLYIWSSPSVSVDAPLNLDPLILFVQWLAEKRARFSVPRIRLKKRCKVKSDFSDEQQYLIRLSI